MPNTAPGAERVAGGVSEDATPAASARPEARAWRWAGAALFLLVVVVLFDAYLHLSKTYPENSDEANILLMANDMLHGNVYLSHWYVSDVPFITTELPQITLLVWLFGLHLNTAHIAAAVTYTLVVAVGMLLAKGRAHGWAAVARMALALAIMLAPQPGVGIFVVIFSVGHIGTALPVMLTWLVLDRLGRKPYVPVLVAVLLAWALMADPLVLVIALYPLLAVCLARVVTGLFTGARHGGGLRGMRQGVLGRRLELSLAAGAGVAYLIVALGRQLLAMAGGYVQQPVPFQLDPARNWWWQARVVVHGLLEMFGAYFVPGNWINYLKLGDYVAEPAPSGLDQAIALTHVLGVVLAVWGACAIARRFFFRDADFVSQLLLAGIVANLAAYIPSTLAFATPLNVREVAPVLPFAAVLAGRMLGDRLLTGPLAAVRLPGFLLAGATPYAGSGRADGAGDAVPDGQAATVTAPAAPGPETGITPQREVRGKDPRRRSLRLRLVAIPLVALFGWYSYGLFRQADTPAAPQPLAGLAAYLEANHLSYGLGGYWDASIITVETGGKVTIRAVTTTCLQPYLWESKTDWYSARLHSANFILLSQEPVNGFAVNGDVLLVLNHWSRSAYVTSKPPPNYYDTQSTGWPVFIDYGGYYFNWVPEISSGHYVIKNGHVVLVRTQPIWYYTARVYPFNLLARLQKTLPQVLNSRPAWLLKEIRQDLGKPVPAC